MYFPCDCWVSQQYYVPIWTTATYRWDLLGQLDSLDNGNLPLLDGAFKIDVLDLLAQIRLGVDQADVSIFDLQVHICALLNLVLYRAGSRDV